ncbi:hypothetical protein GG344DRAFT_84298 [Lentinula edodes]|nr:hypothetical protein GG344DRAFT_84298 [Lentinula edodes]
MLYTLRLVSKHPPPLNKAFKQTPSIRTAANALLPSPPPFHSTFSQSFTPPSKKATLAIELRLTLSPTSIPFQHTPSPILHSSTSTSASTSIPSTSAPSTSAPSASTPASTSTPPAPASASTLAPPAPTTAPMPIPSTSTSTSASTLSMPSSASTLLPPRAAKRQTARNSKRAAKRHKTMHLPQPPNHSAQNLAHVLLPGVSIEVETDASEFDAARGDTPKFWLDVYAVNCDIFTYRFVSRGL